MQLCCDEGGGRCSFAVGGGGRCSFAVMKGASYNFVRDERGVYSFLWMKRANVQQGEVYSTLDEGGKCTALCMKAASLQHFG